MKKTIHKLFWAWQFEEEEKWLNEMAAEGWVLTDVGYCRYEFEPCEKGEYQYKLEYLANRPGDKHSLKYINFIEETGAEYVGNCLKWAYFRKKVAEGEIFDIYSDRNSKIKYFERITGVIGGLAIANLIIGVVNVIIALFDGQFVNMMGILNIVLAAFLYGGYKKINNKCNTIVQEHTLFE
ncbi:MAG: DUF2812 domain-containing protein [Oscillospiraceae bacterium]|nr:DUF2812 domain-containing protein [Oscillospiraceae bacterium]